MSRGYCLKWNKYNTIFQSSFGSLLTSEELTDVTFVCEGQFINCHRLVIAAASQYFKDIFVRLTQPNPVVVLNDVKYTVFKALIDFIYCGEIQVQKDLLEAVVKAGEKFHVRGLNEADESNTCGTSTEDRHNEVEFNQESHTKRRKIDDPVDLQKTGTHLEDTRLDSALTRSIPRPSQPVSVNTVQVYTHASNLKKELCENASSNEDSFLREAESADFDYAEAEIDEENEQGEYQFEQSDFALNADGDDQEELLKFGLEAEPQCLTIALGSKFKSHQEMQTAIGMYCREQGIKLFTKDSQKMEKAVQDKKTEKKALRCNPGLIYYKLEFCCVQGGKKYKSKSRGERRPSTMRLDCPFKIKIGVTNDGKYLEIYGFKNEHNHQKGVLERISFHKEPVQVTEVIS